MTDQFKPLQFRELRYVDAKDTAPGPDFETHPTGTQARIARLDAENEALKDDLRFVERLANHHGAKPHTTPAEALSSIQHYPPIKTITKSYSDGVVPDTFDPYAVIAAQRKLLEQALDCWVPRDSCLHREITEHLKGKTK